MCTENGHQYAADQRAELRRLRAATQVDAPVLLMGGTAKAAAMVARLIHNASPRAARPLVVFRSESLDAVEMDPCLFGYFAPQIGEIEQLHSGCVQQAEGGTLFIDDISALPGTAQARLLQLVEHQTVSPIGSVRDDTVDVRVIAGIGTTLAPQEYSTPLSRALRYRLGVITADVPTLYQPVDNGTLLIERFMKDLARETLADSQRHTERIHHYSADGRDTAAD